MSNLISKSALLAEIEWLVNNYDKALDYEAALEDVRDFIDNYESKEVDSQVNPQVKESAEIQHVDETCKENGNSLTKEPVSIWHDMSEEAENGRNTIIIAPKDFYGAVLRKGGSQLRNHNKERYVKWAYIDDLLNVSNVQRTVKNWKEPVSEDLGKAEKFIDEHTKYCSNLAHFEESNGNVWEENTPWLTPDQARKAVEIAKEEVIEDLEKAAVEAFKQIVDSDKNNFLEIFKAGAKWQAEQFEKNRLAACDRQAEEEAEIERDFVMGIIENEHRQPTFDDAIKYGMRLQKEQMIAKAVDGEVTYGKSLAIPSLGWVLDKERLDYGDKVKLIIIKED